MYRKQEEIMKIIATTLAITMFATTSFAGGVSVSSAAHLPAEGASMAGGAGIGQWVIPLLAIGLIAIAASGGNDEEGKVKIPCGEPLGADVVC